MGRSADDLLRRLVAVGFLPTMPDEDLRERAREACGGESDARALARGVFVCSGLMLCIDMEVDEYPVRYDALLGQLAAISRGAFNPANVRQFFHGDASKECGSDPESFYAPYTVRFSLDGTDRELRFLGTGAWYNADEFVCGINRILKGARHEGRFTGPDTRMYQDRSYIYADRRLARQVAKILGWKLDRRLGS